MTAEGGMNERVRLLRRIEELEEAYRVATSTEHLPPGCGKHIITDDQIDAAWERMNRLQNSENNAEHFMGRGVEAMLKQDFNIVRCEGCCGNKVVRGGYSIEQQRYEAIECPDCNGHGRVIGGDDE